jgi:hypothetical protein
MFHAPLPALKKIEIPTRPIQPEGEPKNAITTSLAHEGTKPSKKKSNPQT